ncbi:MAG: hypothetical protein WB561_10175 [Terracidiphilus sp.]
MRHFSPVNASLILRVTSNREDRDAPTTETDQHELSRLLRYRLAVLEAALRRVDELRREAAKANLRLLGWVTDQIIQDVPGSIEVCEFNCRKSQCTLGEWETCCRRLHNL